MSIKRKSKYTMKNIVNIYNNLDVTVKATLWYTVYNVLVNGLSFLLVPVYARIMSQVEYGKYNVFQSWSSIFLIFGSLYMDAGVFSNGMVRYKDRRDEYLSSMYGITGIASVFFLLLIVITYPFIEKYLGINLQFIIIIFISNYFSIIIRLWGERQKYELKYKRYTVLMSFYTLVQSGLGLILIVCIEPESKYRILAIVLCNVLIGGSLFLKKLLSPKALCNYTFWDFAVRFNMAIIPHYFAYTIFTQSDRIMIERMCGTGSVAIYSLAYSVGTIAATISNAMSASMTPVIYEALRQKKCHIINNKIMSMSYILGIVTIMISLVSPEIIQIIGSSTYAESKDIIPIICLGYFIYFIVAAYGIVLFYYEDKKKIVFGSLVTALLNIILNFIFIRKYGYRAAAYTTLVCYLSYLIVNIHFAKKLVFQNIYEKLNNMKSMFIWICFVTVICFGITWLSDYLMVRYLIFIIGIAIAVVYIGRLAMKR